MRLDDVDAAVRRSGAAPEDLVSAYVALRGPVLDESARGAAQDRAWDRVRTALDDAVAGRPELAEWAAGLRLRRVADDAAAAAQVVARMASVLRAPPAADEPVGVFARRTLGRAHALDEPEPIARLLLPAVAILAGQPDEVTVSGRVLAACARAGQPAVLTLRQLVRDPPRMDLVGRTVSVCEGPVVVSAAADRLGARCTPLVCTGGQPTVAALRLLRLLVDAAARLRYHGDFDWGGLRIANLVFDRLPATPWRFDAASYRQAAGSDLTAPLRGRPAVAEWDPTLSEAMTELGRRVEEEAVDTLLADLDG